MAEYKFDNPDDAYREAQRLIAEAADLGNLELDLSGLGLASVPPDIGRLTKLTTLYVSRNKLASLPSEISSLEALFNINAHENQIRSLPPEIGRVAKLSVLTLMSNNLAALPKVMKSLGELDFLFLHDNPSLKIPPDVLGSDPRNPNDNRSYGSAQSILDFYFAREADAAKPLDEVKLILVGRGAAGKTSTVRALLDQPFDADEESTSGIALSDWVMDDCKKGPVTAHIWDFAGQVMTHALHQFFFSVRSLYVLVLTGRENSEREDAEYWLRLIKAFGTDEHGHGPPVIVALNKWDLDGCRPKVDKGALQERYPFIRKFIPLDCKTGRGVNQLKAALTKEADRLEWVHEPFPGKWDTIRRKLRTGGKRKAFLPYADFRKLCGKHGEPDAGRQDSLAEILHRLGAAINYRMDKRLREATVLQPPWLTKNVYALMRKAEKLNGLLTREEIDKTLYRIKDQPMRDYLIRIMERFEIAFTRPNAPNVWVVPQALPDEQPKEAADFGLIDDATRLRYSYQALPEGLVPRAIVRLHDFIEGRGNSAKRWASGAILTRDGARALLRTEPQDRQVMVTVTGPKAARRKLAGLCQAELRDIHDGIRGLDPIEETEVAGQWVRTKTLEADETQGRSSYVSTDQGSVEIDPKEANSRYSLYPSRDENVWKPKVFISYSKSNVQQRKRLESELKILKNEGLLAGHWHDRMVDPGDDWDDTIQRELAEADVVILLVSAAMLATDYVTEREIPETLKRHRSKKTVLVPVILEKSRWDNSALAKLQVLPEKGKPLNKWTPRSDAWDSVAAGLARVFKRLMKSRSR